MRNTFYLLQLRICVSLIKVTMTRQDFINFFQKDKVFIYFFQKDAFQL